MPRMIRTATGELSDRDPERLSLSDTSPGMDAATIIGRTASGADSADKKPEAAQKTAGKLPPTSSDSFSAAAEILRKLAKYR